MLRKCAYAIISQQELSAQQVASYLMDFEDHFSSHSYRNLYWTSFEAFIKESEKRTGSQLGDYQKRGEELNDTCVWDFISLVDKEADHSKGSVMHDDSRKRPRVPLQTGHEQAKTHIFCVCAPDDILIPVPIGPGIPRRDKEQLREKYCRLMPIFFKPWRHAVDLKDTHPSWECAFDEFIKTCSQSVLPKMNNMQILHECRDSRDDHFAERRSRVRRAVKSAGRRQRRELLTTLPEKM
ncbi:hypothetical protein B0H13DRAFT_1621961 [Mycena leptocephala]|nr:hypothetical protein B0H13DRAFT_1621961 [Mycena leptocephala]